MDRAGERLVGSRYHRPLANYQDFLLDQRPRNRFSRAFKDAGEGRAGNAHPFRRSLLVKPLEIGQPKGLELIESQLFDFKAADRATDGLETPSPGHASDPPNFFRSCHFATY